MGLTAYRPEYHLLIDAARNRLCYLCYEALSVAPELPHYLTDWQRALAQLRPGFTVLTDLSLTRGPNLGLLPTFAAAQQLVVAAGVRAVAEVHPRGSATRQTSAALQRESALPVRIFHSVADAEAFLNSLPVEA